MQIFKIQLAEKPYLNKHFGNKKFIWLSLKTLKKIRYSVKIKKPRQ